MYSNMIDPHCIEDKTRLDPHHTEDGPTDLHPYLASHL